MTYDNDTMKKITAIAKDCAAEALDMYDCIDLNWLMSAETFAQLMIESFSETIIKRAQLVDKEALEEEDTK